MDHFNTKAVNSNKKEKAESLTGYLKDSAGELYEEGKQKMNNLEDCMEEYATDLLDKVKENPLTSLLLAGGIGFILAKLLKK